ncbi:hypothetical protein CVD28_13955 [Bacillus sp. M6-12]|uniref:hypothetical protein n=1 Tax=Bacillus sp. M6-12 TaxID=2054166 RepID=UPI000C760742|nr:hypothetical protein [Bacillus sp. M6-12]PLS17153.1 hypothetical protein CVD28_13955 [Bacillus sp. M6-12]
MKNIIEIRSFKNTDKDFIITLSERFNDFAYMGWRNRDAMLAAQERMAVESVKDSQNHPGMFLAEDFKRKNGRLPSRNEETDYFTNQKLNYIFSIAVSKEGEGKGIASQLMG